MALGFLFSILAYSCIMWSCVAFLFCDDQNFGESKWRCRLRDASKDGKSIVRVEIAADVW